MGGFVGRDPKSDSEQIRLNLDSIKEATPDLHPGLLARTAVPDDELVPNPVSPKPKSRFVVLLPEGEIRDKSKSGGIGKFLTVAQTAWFIIQFLERWVAHKPRTQLEIMTLSYAVLNILIYILWWDKPQDVIEPIYISSRTCSDIPPRNVGVLKMLKWHGHESEYVRLPKDWIFYGTLPIVGVLFGGVHCFAWHFHFPTRTANSVASLRNLLHCFSSTCLSNT